MTTKTQKVPDSPGSFATLTCRPIREIDVTASTFSGASSYTEMNVVLTGRTGLRPFDFDRPDERAAMGYLLGRITADAFDEVGAMLSALVQYLDENDAGGGFFDLAITMRLLPTGASADERLEFWSGQVGAVHQYFRRSFVRRGQPRGI